MSSALDVGSEKQLFIDDWLIDSLSFSIDHQIDVALPMIPRRSERVMIPTSLPFLVTSTPEFASSNGLITIISVSSGTLGIEGSMIDPETPEVGGDHAARVRAHAKKKPRRALPAAA